MVDKFQTHLFTYRHDGAEWVLAIDATDADDARARIGKLAYATYNGVAVSRMPAVLTPFGILSIWLRNAYRRYISECYAERK
jgi:hypothetical protein